MDGLLEVSEKFHDEADERLQAIIFADLPSCTRFKEENIIR
jgi:hypothetical protein